MPEYSDEELKQFKQTASLEVKLELLFKKVLSMEKRLDNGISESVYRNSWAVGILGSILVTLFAGLLVGVW